MMMVYMLPLFAVSASGPRLTAHPRVDGDRDRGGHVQAERAGVALYMAGQRPELAAGLRLGRLGGVAGGQDGDPGRIAGCQLRVASGSPSLHIFAVTIQ
jgi:hypothetical protein